MIVAPNRPGVLRVRFDPGGEHAIEKEWCPNVPELSNVPKSKDHPNLDAYKRVPWSCTQTRGVAQPACRTAECTRLRPVTEIRVPRIAGPCAATLCGNVYAQTDGRLRPKVAQKSHGHKSGPEKELGGFGWLRDWTSTAAGWGLLSGHQRKAPWTPHMV